MIPFAHETQHQELSLGRNKIKPSYDARFDDTIDARNEMVQHTWREPDWSSSE